MRRILITLAILVVCIVAVSATWIFRGRQISLFLDRFGTIETDSARIRSIVYEGSGTGGILHINDLALGLNDKNRKRDQDSAHNEKYLFGTNAMHLRVCCSCGFACGRAHSRNPTFSPICLLLASR